MLIAIALCVQGGCRLRAEPSDVLRLIPWPAGSRVEIQIRRELDIHGFGADGKQVEASRVEEQTELREHLLQLEGSSARRLQVAARVLRRLKGPGLGQSPRAFETTTTITFPKGRLQFSPPATGPVGVALRKHYSHYNLPGGIFGPFRIMRALEGRNVNTGMVLTLESRELAEHFGELPEAARGSLPREGVPLHVGAVQAFGRFRCRTFSLRLRLDGADRRQVTHGEIQSEYAWDPHRARPCRHAVRLSLESRPRRGRIRLVRLSGKRTTDYAFP